MFRKVLALLIIVLAITLISSLAIYSTLDDVNAQTIITKNGGSGAVATPTPGPIPPFTDTNALVADSADATKRIRFAVGGLTTGTTRVLTVPDSNFTVAMSDVTQTWSGFQVFGGGLATSGGIFVLGSSFLADPMFIFDTNLTPDSPYFGAGIASNALHMGEVGDYTFDFNNGSCGTSACTDPALIIHSHNQSTAQWLQLSHNAVNAVIATGTGGLILPGAIHTAGTVPVVSNTTANSCGTTTATITGTDATGKIVVGATSGTSCTITFNVAAPTRRQCWASDETTAVLTRFIYLTTTTGKVDGVFTAGDTLEYGCLTY